MNINGLILAAGHSSRLGCDKQLVKYCGNSLIRHTELKLEELVQQLFVVLGHHHKTIQTELKSATCIINTNWPKGMGTSLACGVKTAKNDADAILIALCDQPLIPQSHYQQMINRAENHPNKIIATGYAGISGVPVIFPSSHFFELALQTNQLGAQGLINANQKTVITINCDAAAFDVDMPCDLNQL